jgi:hypothetical protein
VIRLRASEVIRTRVLSLVRPFFLVYAGSSLTFISLRTEPAASLVPSRCETWKTALQLEGTLAVEEELSLVTRPLSDLFHYRLLVRPCQFIN